MRILKFNKFIVLNELVKNVKSVISHIDHICKEVKSIYPYVTFNISENDHLSICKLKETDVKKVEQILSKFKQNLLREDIIISFAINNGAAAINEIEIGVKFKNIHTKRVFPNRFLYHSTTKENIDSILKNGLIPVSHSDSKEWSKTKGLEYPPAIFVTNSYNPSDVWGIGDAIKIDTKGLKNKWWEDLNFSGLGPKSVAIMTFEPIPPSHLKLVTKEDIEEKKREFERENSEKNAKITKEKEIETNRVLDTNKEPKSDNKEIEMVVMDGTKEVLDWFLKPKRPELEMKNILFHMILLSKKFEKDNVYDYIISRFSDMIDMDQVNRFLMM